MRIENKKIAVWFSCGAASAVAAKITLEEYRHNNEIHILNNFVLEEGEDNRRFLNDVSDWLGYPIEQVASKDFPNGSAVEVWKKRRYMSGINGAPCTELLKKKARQEWENINNPDWHVFGFTYEELNRHIRFTKFERANVIPILIQRHITKDWCLEYLKNEGLKLPIAYEQKFPNANCIGCVKSSSPHYWNLVRQTYPTIFEEREKLSREIGARLVRYKGKRIFLDELPIEKIEEIKEAPDCGIICETK